MVDEIVIAQKYLLPPTPCFWHWCESGEVISWKGGGTITFRAELVEVLRLLAPAKLPPLSSLLLVLAATRDDWSGIPFEVGDSAAWGFASEEASDIVASLFVDRQGLNQLQNLEHSLRSSIEAKVVLAELIFERVEPAATPSEAAAILQYLEHGIEEVLSEGYRTSAGQPTARRLTLEDLRDVRRGLASVDAETLRLRRRTGLDQLPGAADVELPPTQQVRALLGKLQHDDELQGLARLARQLMAAVSLPRAVSDPDEMQCGGVSDITSRGPLDRLLLTELVHDDLTLAVRISVNEALYLRRESPPQTPDRERVLLIDSGIRCWGVPRVFATAVALALAATTDPHTRIVAYRASGSELTPVDLLSREGLVEHLEVLRLEIHPGEALETLAEQFKDADHAVQPVLITAEEVLGDQEFAQALAKARLAKLHVATVNRDGDFRLIEKNERGRKLLREARLDLASLLPQEESPQAPSLIDRGRAKDLPAIFAVTPFPLLLSHNPERHQMMHLNDQGIVCITSDRRLLHWHRKQPVGAVQLSDDLPSGRLQWYTHEAVNETVFAALSDQSRRALQLLKIQLRERACEVLPLNLDATARVISVHHRFLFVLQENNLTVIDIESGEMLETRRIPDHLHWKQDRFFRDPMRDQWYAASYDGRSARLEPVFEDNPDKTPWLVLMFECRGVEGPIGLTRNGDICYTATGEIWQVAYPQPTPQKVGLISHHGNHILVRIGNSTETFVLDVVARTVTSWQNVDARNLLHPHVSKYVTPRNVRHRFSHIAVEAADRNQGRLVLTARKQRRLAIQYVDANIPASKRIRLLPVTAGEAGSSSAQSFRQVKSSKYGFSLRRAEWEDGSEAFLDSRGLLHLRSADQAVPEVTIVLTDGELGGWCSDGRLWGAEYYTGKSFDPAVDQDVYERAIAGFIRGVR